MPSPEEIQQARFANTFKDTTNLAQRRRYQEDIEEFDSTVRQEGRERYDRALSRAEMKDPLESGRLRLAREKEGRMRNEGINREDRLFRQDQLNEKKFITKADLEAKKLELDELKAEVTMEKQFIEMDDAKMVLTQTRQLTLLDKDLRSRGVKPGSKEYADVMGGGLAQAPYAPPEFRRNLAAQARIEMDPDELALEADEFVKSGGGMTMTVGADGKRAWRFIKPPARSVADNPDKQRRELEKEWRELSGNAEKENDPAMAPYWKKRAEAVGKKLLEFDNPAAATPAAAPGATATPAPAATPAAPPAAASTPAPAVQKFKAVDGKLIPRE